MTQTQNNLEIELNSNKIHNSSYDRQSFTNEKESDSDDNDKVPLLVPGYNSKGIEIDSDDEEIDSDDDDANEDVSAMKSLYNNTEKNENDKDNTNNDGQMLELMRVERHPNDASDDESSKDEEADKEDQTLIKRKGCSDSGDEKVEKV